MRGSGRGHGEPVRLLDPAPEERQQGQRDQRHQEHATESEAARRQAVRDGDDSGAGAVPGGDERHCLGPVRRGGLLCCGDLRQPVRGAEQRAPAGEDSHEPPVAGAGRGQHGQEQPRPDRDEQHLPAAEVVGQASDGKRAQRRKPHDGQPDPQVGARQSRLVGEGRAVVHLAEPPGHVAEGGYHAELPEPRGEGGDCHTDHGPVVPAMQPQPRRLRNGGRARMSAHPRLPSPRTCPLGPQDGPSQHLLPEAEARARPGQLRGLPANAGNARTRYCWRGPPVTSRVL